MAGPKISVVFGTRPEAIKLAPVILALRRDPRISCQVCVTAQHREMLDQVLSVFAIRPDTDLNLMRSDQTLAELSAHLLHRLDAVFADSRPDLVLVQGDTTTSFCAALAAFYRHIPIGHVEAGLRTGNLQAPWPEEANRVLTSRLAALHFAPTEANRRNLLAEGIAAANVHVTGNTVVDALLLAVESLQRPAPTPAMAEELELIEQVPDPMVLVTAHRRESFGPGLESICQAVLELARRFPDTHFVYPVHLNPRVGTPVRHLLGDSGLPNVRLLAPLSYLAFVKALHRAYLILTDSGGIQEEAPSLGKPVLILRATTERPEVIKAGCARLVGTDTATICAETSRLLTDPDAYRAMTAAPNPYGDGLAARRIAAICGRMLS
ncbi:MAG: UDP-N-acetylglucosamine 2-epimerase [Syntrophobacteraceae bacterium CG2_30_61_12]|nr:MAG: UDP-N-acetylglucosamine 2-epimerase [Syntrophobacteraceae bacterium CG2_30_61_12]